MKGKSKIQLALWVLLFIVAIPLSAYGVDGQIKITQPTIFPITITESGSYVLTSNLTVTTADVPAITIDADNVTLDLNGHTIYGPGTGSGIGIFAVDYYNITIKNGIVRDFDDGISVSASIHGTANGAIEGIRASNNNTNGITAHRGTVTNCTAYNNGHCGIDAEGGAVTNCTGWANTLAGIWATLSTVTNCTANGNGSFGIHTYDSTVTNCTANYNSGYGIYATLSTVTNCTANGNGSDGIYVAYSTVKGCNVRDNTGYGINMATDYHNYIYRNAASDNITDPINCLSGNICMDNLDIW